MRESIREPTDPSPDVGVGSGVRVRSLICHRDVSMGVQCLGSLARSVAGARFVFHDDGSLTDEDVAELTDKLPVEAVVRRAEANEYISDLLAKHPSCRRARAENVMMLKLFDVALIGGGDICYCDTDVLFFRKTAGLFKWTQNDPAAVFMRDSNHAYAARPWHLWGRDRIRLPKYVNAGMFMFRREKYDLDFLEWLLSVERMRSIQRHIAWWAEQTCWAAMAFRAGCGLWDREQIAVVGDDWALGERTIAAHFVASSRHKLAAARQLASEIDPAGLDRTTVRIVKASECTVFDLGRSQIARRLRRACGF